MIWGTISGRLKTYLLLTLSGLVTVLALMLKLSGSRSRRLKRQAETYRAKAIRAEVVMKKDAEVEREHDLRTEELANEIEKSGTSDELRNPNDW